jgi:hypothetical protein
VNHKNVSTAVAADVDELPGAANEALITSRLYGTDFGRSILTFNVGGGSGEQMFSARCCVAHCGHDRFSDSFVYIMFGT